MAAQTADGRGNAGGLLKLVLSTWRLTSPDDLIRHVYGSSAIVELLTQLSMAVDELATRGDSDARVLIERAGKALAVHVDTVVRKLGLKEPPLALGGAALRGNLRKTLLSSFSVPMGPVSVVQDPAVAAVTMAQRMMKMPA
jgi:N-acetylglucosamine kinase-like BadF-type ATPase